MIKSKMMLAGAATAALALGSVPASAQYYRGGGWSPGAAAAVGVLGGLALGTAVGAASARPAYGPPPGYYAPPPRPVYGECYIVHRRVWVPGWGWDVRPREICD